MNIGENIRKIRKEKGLTQKELGELLGRTQRTVQGWERGEVKPPKTVLEKLSEVLNINVRCLIEGENLEESIKSFHALTPCDDADIVENIIRMLKQVALDERIDKNIRDGYLADLSEQIGFDIAIDDKQNDFKLDKNTHDNIMKKFTEVM